MQSHIEHVTVYRSGARVTRAVELKAPFPDEIRVADLPMAAIDGTLEASIRGHEGLRAVDLRFDLEPPPLSTAAEPALDAALQHAEIQHKLAEASTQRLKSLVGRMEKLEILARAEPAEGKAPSPSPVQARMELVEFQHTQLAALRAEWRDAVSHQQRTAEALNSARQDLAQATTSRQPREHELRRTAVVRLHGGGDQGTARLELSYVVPGAGWVPGYVLNLESDLDRGRLVLSANVRQRTGEDWSGVALRLSTAEPSAFSELPELKSLRIGRAQAPSTRRWRAAPSGLSALFADFDRAAAPQEIAYGAEPPDDESMEELSGLVGGSLEAEDEAPVAVSYAAMDMPEADAAPMPSSAPMAPPQMMRSRAMRAPAPGRAKKAMTRGGGSARPLRRPKPLEPTLSARLMDYAGLLMASPDEGERGSLRARPRSYDARGPNRAASLQQEPWGPGRVVPGPVDGFDHAWSVNDPAHIPADGALHTVVVSDAPLELEPRFLCVPRESDQVFRTLAFRNPAVGPLLAGPLDVYVAGRFLLDTRLRATDSDAEVELGLGVEQRIKVARNARYDEKEGGLLRTTISLEQAVEIELKSGLGRAARVEVRERLPIPHSEAEEEMTVKLGPVQPRWERYEPDDRELKGGHRWFAEVQPGATLTLRYTYTVEIPGKHQLLGGNRREG